MKRAREPAAGGGRGGGEWKCNLERFADDDGRMSAYLSEAWAGPTRAAARAGRGADQPDALYVVAPANTEVLFERPVFAPYCEGIEIADDEPLRFRLYEIEGLCDGFACENEFAHPDSMRVSGEFFVADALIAAARLRLRCAFACSDPDIFADISECFCEHYGHTTIDNSSDRYTVTLKPEIFAAPPAPRDDPPACCACLVEPATHAFFDCGHRCVCADCAAEVMRREAVCPICRAPIDRAVQIYT